jgi:hypothetical protein
MDSTSTIVIQGAGETKAGSGNYELDERGATPSRVGRDVENQSAEDLGLHHGADGR